MSDDLERQIRERFRTAPLPAAPEHLRAALLDVTSGAAAPRRRGRMTSWLLPAAVAAAIVLAVTGVLGPGLQTAPAGPPATGSASPSAASPSAASPITLPAPPADVQVLTATQLRTAIAAQRAGGRAPQDVVVDVAIDASRQTPPLTRECVPIGTCQVIGTLDGFTDPDGTVTIRQSEFIIAPPTTPADLRPPVALRLSGTAPIEYLGHVGLGDGSLKASVAQALAATAKASDGQVVAVDGWLEGIAVGFSCGPAPMPGPPMPEPFRCHVTPMLMAEPAKPVTGFTNGYSLRFPDGSIPVQEGAYDEYAPSPATDGGMNDEPRHGLYLLRMVVHDAVNCVGCRGWLVVGRLDAAVAQAPTASPSPAASVTVRSAAELAALLATDRTKWIGRPVFVDGQVSPIFGTFCPAGSTCQIGILAGTTESVVATAYTRSLLLPDTDFPTHGVMALIVRPQGLEYLGYMGYNNDSSFNFGVDQLLDPQHMARGPETVVVTGWLIDLPPISCPTQLPAPPDTPFENCGWAWISRDEFQPVITSNGFSLATPPNAIRVQPAINTDFAPDPAYEANGVAHVPRYGTFLVRLVSYPPSAADAQRGWQVVARLDP